MNKEEKKFNTEWIEDPRFSEDEKDIIKLELSRLKEKYTREGMKFQVKVDYDDLKHLEAVLDVLADVGKELMFKEPKFSARIGLSTIEGRKIIMRYK